MMRRFLGCLLFSTLVTGCSSEELVNPIDKPVDAYDVKIRRTSFGVPHILAEDMPSAWFGMGYAGAQDWTCILADQVIMANGERARYFGPGVEDEHIDSDFFHRGVRAKEKGIELLDNLDEDLRGLLDAYVEGYNHHLSEVGVDGLPLACRGQAWVEPLTAERVAAFYYVLNLLASALPFRNFFMGALPPSEQRALTKPRVNSLPNFRELAIGSNAWGVGSERSLSGNGLLLGNPHFPWFGELKWHESHLRVPGMIDVYGASLIGVPVINIGFTESVAWTHTVTPSSHFTVYQVDLVPGNPLKYLYDGEERGIEKTEVTIDVLQDDGTLAPRSRNFYRSHYGPMVRGPQVDWNESIAYSYRDANEDNDEIFNVWFAKNRALSVDDIIDANTEHQGIPWVYTITADSDGRAMLMDASRVPRLSPVTEANLRSEIEGGGPAASFYAQGAILLPGGSADSEWSGINDGGEGLVPLGEAPQLMRNDYVMNANEDPWLTNHLAPIESYSLMYGVPADPMTPRSRTNVQIVSDLTPAGGAGEDGMFSLEELRDASLSNRASVAAGLRDEVVARCTGVTMVDRGGQMVDISEACSVLGGWDLLLNLDSVGAVVWREMLGEFRSELTDAGSLYAVPFDPTEPLTTPNTLAPPPMMGDDPILQALAQAVLNLESAGFTATSTLGDMQFTLRGTERIPIHGGSGNEGATNVVGFGNVGAILEPLPDVGAELNRFTGLHDTGYPITFGTSFIFAAELTATGPEAYALLSYSESSDPESPHHSDQTRAFSNKEWRKLAFSEADIEADLLTEEHLVVER